MERLRFLHQMRAHKEMLGFRIEELVSFEPEDHSPVFGILTRYNRKTVTVIAEDGRQWNVSPHLLRKVKFANDQKDAARTKVVSLKEVS